MSVARKPKSFAAIAMEWELWPRARQIIRHNFEPKEVRDLIRKVAERKV